jgi:PAS domain S-box-containing protein
VPAGARADPALFEGDPEGGAGRLLDFIADVPGIVWEVELTPDGRTARFMYLSDSAERILGYSHEHLLRPESWSEMVHPDDVLSFWEQQKKLFAEGDRGTMQHRIIAADGRTISIEATITKVSDASGKPIALRGLTLDISERKRFEQRLEEAKEAAEVASRTKDQFIAALSHELRTPLTPVLATLELLAQDGEFPEAFRPFLDIIRRNVEIETRLIDDLLDMTRIAKGKLRMSETELDLHTLIPEVIDICRLDLDRSGLRVVTRFEARYSFVHGDRDRLSQVLWNLLHNASKFTPSGGLITIRTRNEAPLNHLTNGSAQSADQSCVRELGSVIIEVEDTGCGIDADDLGRIFDPFEQEASAAPLRIAVRTESQAGLGLGLAISRSIVEMHGGSIEATSAGLGKGATFILRLQSRRLPFESPPEIKPTLHKKEVSKVILGTGGKILFVDDHADTNAALKVLLERRGYTVVTAASVAGGLELSRIEEFDLLVSDIGLPDGDGTDLLRAIHKERPMNAIAVSGYGTDADIERSRQAGFAFHLKKPIAFPELERAIAEMLARPKPRP